MAKPIEPTPILEGKDAKIFIENMLKEQSDPSKKRVDFIKKALEDSRKFRIVQ